MQAIVIKYLPATNTRPARQKATALAGSITVRWDDSTDQHTNLMIAAHRLCEKLGWNGMGFTFGTLPNGDHVAVLTAPQ